MRTVWKFALGTGLTDLSLVGARMVHVGIDPTGQQDWPSVWIEHTTGGNEADQSRYAFYVIGTGQEAPHLWHHVGSTITDSGLVWHVYARGFS